MIGCTLVAMHPRPAEISQFIYSDSASWSATDPTSYWYIDSSQTGAAGTFGIEFYFQSTGSLWVYHYYQIGGVPFTNTYYLQESWLGGFEDERSGTYELKVTVLTNAQGGTTGVTTTSLTLGTWAALSSPRWFKYAKDHTVLGRFKATFSVQIRRATDTRLVMDKTIQTTLDIVT